MRFMLPLSQADDRIFLFLDLHVNPIVSVDLIPAMDFIYHTLQLLR